MAKRACTGDGKQPRKLRRLSGFNLFHREFLKSKDAQDLSSLGEKNKISSAKWRGLTQMERDEYNERAINAETELPSVPQKKELRRVLANLSNLADHMKTKMPGSELMFTLVQKDMHYCGGTNKGCQYLEQTPWIPYSFLGSLASKPGSHSCTQVPKANLRVRVEKLFNHLYGLAVHIPTARLPYSKIESYGISIEGLPDGKALKHPSSYGTRTLNAILERKDSIRLKITNPPLTKKVQRTLGGESPSDRNSSESPSAYLSGMAANETVLLPTCITSSSVDEFASQPPVSPTLHKPSSTNPHSDHTYSVTGCETQKVTLLSSRGHTVGIASLVDGDTLHGRAIPAGYSKVVIEYVKPGTLPMIRSNFDEEELSAGQFTAWATACIASNS